MVYKVGQPRPPGSGRKRGVPGKSTPRGKRLAAIKESGLTPLDYMIEVLRDPNAGRDDRRWAAVSAAPYLHPKLMATTLADGKDLPVNLAMTDKELARRVALILTMADRNVGGGEDGPKATPTPALDTLTKPDKMH